MPGMKHSDFATAGATIAAFLAAAFSCWAAWEAHGGVQAANNATRATVMLQLVTEYGGSEIHGAIQALRAWQQDHLQSPVDAFGILARSKDSADEQRYDQLTGSLRTVSSYFEKLQLMSELQLVDRTLLGQLWSCSTYNDLIAKLVVPMNLVRVDMLVERNLLQPGARLAAQQEAKKQLAFYSGALCRPGAP